MPRSLFVQTDRKLVRATGGSRRHLAVEVVAPRRPTRRPVNLALVLDRSGSMHGDKLNLAREGAIRAVRSLGDEDRVSVVVYNERVVVLIPSRIAGPEAREHAETLLRRIPDDATRVTRAWRLAYSRPPSSDEIAFSLEYVDAYSRHYKSKFPDRSDVELRSWQSLCRAIMGANEFLFVE